MLYIDHKAKRGITASPKIWFPLNRDWPCVRGFKWLEMDGLAGWLRFLNSYPLKKNFDDTISACLFFYLAF